MPTLMPTIGLVIPPEVVDRLSPALRRELFAFSPFAGLSLMPEDAAGTGGRGTQPPPPESEVDPDPGSPRVAHLSPAQARAFWEGNMGARPRAALRFMCEENRNAIPWAEMIAALGPDARGGIGSALAGLTNRFKAVVPDRPANVHFYRAIHDGQNGWLLHISPVTLASFREFVLDA